MEASFSTLDKVKDVNSSPSTETIGEWPSFNWGMSNAMINMGEAIDEVGTTLPTTAAVLRNPFGVAADEGNKGDDITPASELPTSATKAQEESIETTLPGEDVESSSANTDDDITPISELPISAINAEEESTETTLPPQAAAAEAPEEHEQQVITTKEISTEPLVTTTAHMPTTPVTVVETTKQPTQASHSAGESAVVELAKSEGVKPQNATHPKGPEGQLTPLVFLGAVVILFVLFIQRWRKRKRRNGKGSAPSPLPKQKQAYTRLSANEDDHETDWDWQDDESEGHLNKVEASNAFARGDLHSRASWGSEDAVNKRKPSGGNVSDSDEDDFGDPTSVAIHESSPAISQKTFHDISQMPTFNPASPKPAGKIDGGLKLKPDATVKPLVVPPPPAAPSSSDLFMELGMVPRVKNSNKVPTSDPFGAIATRNEPLNPFAAPPPPHAFNTAQNVHIDISNVDMTAWGDDLEDISP